MNFRDLAQDYLRQARARLKTAQTAVDERNFPYAIRASQEAVEYSLKAALRWVNIEYPKEHDAGPDLLHFRKRFPKWFDTRVDEMSELSGDLAGIRGLATYGDEKSGRPPSALFRDLAQAQHFVSDATKVVRHVGRLLTARA